MIARMPRILCVILYVIWQLLPFSTLAGKSKPDTLRILAIGNSFSVDALEFYLHDLATAAGKPLVIGNLAIAGGTLEQHVTNIRMKRHPYIYTKIDEGGKKTTTFNNAIEPVLKSERWDYISLQQVSHLSGRYLSFVQPLPALFTYVKKTSANPDSKIILHQIWAYAATATHPGFVSYDKDQQVMYRAIVKAYRKARKLIKADAIVPSGTTIQNARTSFIGDHFNRDGFHLETTYGRYAVACCWFEILFNQSVIGNPYRPDDISAEKIEIAQQAAHAAARRPNRVTILKDYRFAQHPDEEK
ncbi:hypothetical protein GCM10027051_33420 [Niabella terrae]